MDHSVCGLSIGIFIGNFFDKYFYREFIRALWKHKVKTKKKFTIS